MPAKPKTPKPKPKPTPGTDKKGKKNRKDTTQQPAPPESTVETITKTAIETTTETAIETAIETATEAAIETITETATETAIETTTETAIETAAETNAETTTETSAEISPSLASIIMDIAPRTQADGQEAQAEEQEIPPLILRPPTAIEEQVKAAGFSNMGVGPVTAEDSEERQLLDDRTAQILERSRIGTALFYVPILNPVWKVSCLRFSPVHNRGR
jgi:hypothetical protein